MSTYTPFPSTSSTDADENEWWLNREISLIRNLLEAEGPQRRSDPLAAGKRLVRRGRNRWSVHRWELVA